MISKHFFFGDARVTNAVGQDEYFEGVKEQNYYK